MPTIYDAIAASPELRAQFLSDWADAEGKYESAKQSARTFTWEPGKGMVSHLEGLDKIHDEIFDPLRDKWNPELRPYRSAAQDELAAAREKRLEQARGVSPSELVKIQNEIENNSTIIGEYETDAAKTGLFGGKKTFTPAETAKYERAKSNNAMLLKLIGAPTLPSLPGTNAPVAQNPLAPGPSAWAPDFQGSAAGPAPLKMVLRDGRYVFAR